VFETYLWSTHSTGTDCMCYPDTEAAVRLRESGSLHRDCAEGSTLLCESNNVLGKTIDHMKS